MDIEDKDIERQEDGMVTADEEAAVVIPLDVDAPSADGEAAVEGPVEEPAASEPHVEEDGVTAGNADAPGEPEAAQETTKESGDTNPLRGMLGNKSIEDIIDREAKEEDSGSTFSLSKALGGVMVAKMVQSNIKAVLLVCAFIIIYINNRYTCQNKLVEIDKTQVQLTKARYKATVCTSRLTEESRESFILELLDNYGDSTLAIPSDPPYLITVPEE